MRTITFQLVIIVAFCSTIFAQNDSCNTQKELASRFASHVSEKDGYFIGGVVAGTLLPVIGPCIVETKALIKNVSPVITTDQQMIETECFKTEYARRVKIERSKEVLKGGLIGLGASVFFYSALTSMIVSIYFLN